MHDQGTTPARQPATATRPPWSYARVVKACPGLSPRAKLCWLEHYALWLTRAGCTASAAVLGRRIATSQASVERFRSLFQQLAMLDKDDRGLGRTAAWRVTLPPPCRPAGARITDDQCASLAHQLGAYLSYRVNAAQTALTPVGRLTAGQPEGPLTEMREVHPHPNEGGSRYGLLRTAGYAGKAGNAGSGQEGIQEKKADALEKSAQPDDAPEPPTWLTEQPAPEAPPEGDEPEEADDEPA